MLFLLPLASVLILHESTKCHPLSADFISLFFNNRAKIYPGRHSKHAKPQFSYFWAMLAGVHHIAIICSDYPRSKQFYTEILGLTIIREVYRSERGSYKLDLALNGQYVIELFSFPDPPARLSHPEASGLRHIAFAVNDLETVIQQLTTKGIVSEAVRTDEYTGKRFTFIQDPDGLPVELYEE